jgi:hypothetical protein
MKQLRLALSSLALAALTIASTAAACDKDHNTSAAAASSKSQACSAHMMAACQNKGASNVSAAAHCPGMLGVALNLGAAGPAANRGDCCLAKNGAAAVTAGNTSGADHCSAAKGASATTASTGSDAKFYMAGAGGQCSGHTSTSSTARMMHPDCDACADMADCEAELQGSGTRVQLVPLKNGVMFVYTAASAGKVSALQSSLARRTERLNQLVSAGEKAHLCDECKAMRGAMASGKLNREVVNIEGGALTLMTSNDPSMVSKIYALLDVNQKLAKKS